MLQVVSLTICVLSFKARLHFCRTLLQFYLRKSQRDIPVRFLRNPANMDHGCTGINVSLHVRLKPVACMSATKVAFKRCAKNCTKMVFVNGPFNWFLLRGKYSSPNWGGGGRSTPLYKLYRYVLPQRVRFLSPFGLKTGIDFDHRVWFSRKPRERVNVFVFSTPNE